MTNAVRHAAADELYIKIEEKANLQEVVIFDNGSKKQSLAAKAAGFLHCVS